MARDWLTNESIANSAMMFDASSLLMNTRSPRVISLTDGIQGNFFINLARMRNGDAQLGILALLGYAGFGPSIHDEQVELLISQAWCNHRTQLATDLQSMLRAPGLDDETRRGAFLLAGYFGDASLSQAVKDGWDKAASKKHLLREALWAGLRCSFDEPATVLDSMFSELSQIPNEAAPLSLLGTRLNFRLH